MLRRVDRIQVVARSGAEASERWCELFDARCVASNAVESLRARRTVVQLGQSQIEVLEPTGPGAAADHLGAWGPGLFAAGFAVDDLAAMRERLAASGARWTEEGEQILLEPNETRGLRMVLSRLRPEPAPLGNCLLRGLYEVSQLVRSWKETADQHAEMFGLDPARFSEISSDQYGYTGTLLLFDPPQRLDRIELCEITDPDKAMGRFFRRRGESLYMCYSECDDTGALVERLRGAGARFSAPAGEDAPPNLFLHPAATGGVLLGVSRTHHAWTWSGRPELARGPATEG